MTQIFFPPQSDTAEQKTYCYINKFSKVVVAKLRGLEDRDCERVAFPTQKFLFTANDSCELEIHFSTDVGIIRDTIPCSELNVIEQ